LWTGSSRARVLKKAIREQALAESKLPAYPLRPDHKSGSVLVSKEELAYVEKYFNAAAMIANDAADVRAELSRAIKDWGDVVSKAEKITDWTRKAAWEAITLLDHRFQYEGGGFRAYLVDLRDTAWQVEDWARLKQYHAAHILGKWTPDGYQPPTP
jgi:hypothetical protein